jgi:hypothetical protein
MDAWGDICPCARPQHFCLLKELGDLLAKGHTALRGTTSSVASLVGASLALVCLCGRPLAITPCAFEMDRHFWIVLMATSTSFALRIVRLPTL